jgi:hypothetical protein
MNSGRALFLEYMSALSGHPMANMGMGYRYMQGIGVTQVHTLILFYTLYTSIHLYIYTSIYYTSIY